MPGGLSYFDSPTAFLHSKPSPARSLPHEIHLLPSPFTAPRARVFRQRRRRTSRSDPDGHPRGSGGPRELHIAGRWGAVWGGAVSGHSGNAATYPSKITTGVKEVFATGRRVFYLKTDGTLWALGDNSSGEFGNGTQTSSYSQPIQVATDVVSVAPAVNHTLFLKPMRRSGPLGLTATANSAPVKPARDRR